MNRTQMLGLAHAVRDLRPDWDQPGVLHHIAETERTWPGTDPQLYTHVVQVAANPAAQTPAAFHAKITTTAERAAAPARGINEPSCAICGRGKSACQRVHDWEVSHGVPDEHIFESEEEAVGSAVPLTAAMKAEIVSRMASVVKRVDDVPGMAHAVASARAAEELAAAKIAQDGLL